MANDAHSALQSKLFPGLQDLPKSSGPAMPQATPGGSLGEESKNVFTELFGKEKGQANSGLLNTVVRQTEQKTLSYFDGKPREELKLKKFTTHKSNPGATVLQASILLFFLTALVFTTQTSTRFSIFNVNPAVQVETKSAQVDSLNSEVRVQKYLAAVLLLDQFSGLADEYLYHRSQAESAYTSANKQEEHLAFAQLLYPEMVSLLEDVQGYLNEAIPFDEAAHSVAVADEMIARIQLENSGTTNQNQLQAVQDLTTVKALLQDSDFYSTLSALSVTELSDEDIEQVFTEFSAINASLTAVINVIQNDRRDWSLYLDAIESLTKSVDPLFNTEFAGNLSVTSVVFNEDGTVSVSGRTVTNDTKNFTLVANLMDAYENSEFFSDVSERNFQKNDDAANAVYTGSFRISMNLDPNHTTND